MRWALELFTLEVSKSLKQYVLLCDAILIQLHS